MRESPARIKKAPDRPPLLRPTSVELLRAHPSTCLLGARRFHCASRISHGNPAGREAGISARSAQVSVWQQKCRVIDCQSRILCHRHLATDNGPTVTCISDARSQSTLPAQGPFLWPPAIIHSPLGDGANLNPGALQPLPRYCWPNSDHARSPAPTGKAAHAHIPTTVP